MTGSTWGVSHMDGTQPLLVLLDKTSSTGSENSRTGAELGSLEPYEYLQFSEYFNSFLLPLG